jgi:hypothetical protein
MPAGPLRVRSSQWAIPLVELRGHKNKLLENTGLFGFVWSFGATYRLLVLSPSPAAGEGGPARFSLLFLREA